MNFLQHITTHRLRYNGDCSLLGITPDHQLYIEETYSDADGEFYLAQHHLAEDGTLLASMDELYGKELFRPLTLPDDLSEPPRLTHSTALRYAGGRQRGLREEERVTEWVQPLTLPEKMGLHDYFRRLPGLTLPVASPMTIMGIAESIPLAEAWLAGFDQLCVCRRLRIAIALPEPQYAADGQPYDYDTLSLYCLHWYDALRLSAPPVHEIWAELGQAAVYRPMSLLAHAGCLYIGDGGTGETVSRVLVFQVTARS